MVPSAEPVRPEPDLEEVVGERRALINLAYRLLGSLAEAEDAVQEGYARWYAQTPEQRQAIEVPGAWLNKVIGRICLDMLGSARVRREQYVGSWVPEPLPNSQDWLSGRLGGARVDPADRVTLDESISMAFLVVLETMTPAERVAFVLHDVFRYPFAEVADIVGRSPAACRQLASSARRRLRESRTTGVPPERQQRLVREFTRAWEAADIDGLLAVLDPDASVVADGGGQVKASILPIEGARRIARYLLGIVQLMPGVTFRECTVNHRPGLATVQDGVITTVLAFELSGDQISRIWAVRNPDKLGPWGLA